MTFLYVTVLLVLFEEFRCEEFVFSVIQDVNSTCLSHADCRTKYGQSFCSHGRCVCQLDYYSIGNKCLQCSGFQQSCVDTKCCKHSLVSACIDGICKCKNDPEEMTFGYCWRQNQGSRNILSFAKLLLGAILALSLAAMFGILKQLCNRPDVIESTSPNFERNFAYQSYNSIQRFVLNKLKDRPPRYEDINKDGSTASPPASSSNVTTISPIVNHSNLPPSYQAYAESSTGRIDLSIPPPPYTPSVEDPSLIIQSATGSDQLSRGYASNQNSSTTLPPYSQHEILLSPKCMNEKYIKSENVSRRDSSNHGDMQETINHETNNESISKVLKSFQLEDSDDIIERSKKSIIVIQKMNPESIVIDDSKINTGTSHLDSTVPETIIQFDSIHINPLSDDLMDENLMVPTFDTNMNENLYLQTSTKSYVEEISKSINSNETKKQMSQIIPTHMTNNMFVDNNRSEEIVNNDGHRVNYIMETHVDIEGVRDNNNYEMIDNDDLSECCSYVDRISKDGFVEVKLEENDKIVNENVERFDDSHYNNGRILKHVLNRIPTDDGVNMEENDNFENVNVGRFNDSHNNDGRLLKHVRNRIPTDDDGIKLEENDNFENVNVGRFDDSHNNDERILKHVSFKDEKNFKEVQTQMELMNTSENISTDIPNDTCNNDLVKEIDSKEKCDVSSKYSTKERSAHGKKIKKIDFENIDENFTNEKILANDEFTFKEVNLNRFAIEFCDNNSIDFEGTDVNKLHNSSVDKVLTEETMSGINANHFAIDEAVDSIRNIKKDNVLGKDIIKIIITDSEANNNDDITMSSVNPDHFAIDETLDSIRNMESDNVSGKDIIKIIITDSEANNNNDDITMSGVNPNHFAIEKIAFDSIKNIEKDFDLIENIAHSEVITDRKICDLSGNEILSKVISPDYFSIEELVKISNSEKHVDATEDIVTIANSEEIDNRKICETSGKEILSENTLSDSDIESDLMAQNVLNENKIENATNQLVKTHMDLSIKNNNSSDLPEIIVNQFDETNDINIETKVPDDNKISIETNDEVCENVKIEPISEELNGKVRDEISDSNKNRNIIRNEDIKNEPSDSKCDS